MLTSTFEEFFQITKLYVKLKPSKAHITLSFVPGGEMCITIALSSASKCTSGGPIWAAKKNQNSYFGTLLIQCQNLHSTNNSEHLLCACHFWELRAHR